MLFSDQRRHSLVLPAKDQDGKPSTIASLIHHLCEHVMKDTRKELFVLQDHLYVSSRPSPSPLIWSVVQLLARYDRFDLVLFDIIWMALCVSINPSLSSSLAGKGSPRRFLIRSTISLHYIATSVRTDANSNRRPGILVLINDADWELEGEEEYELKSGDNILFVSTLHGG